VCPRRKTGRERRCRTCYSHDTAVPCFVAGLALHEDGQ
jgi:hypothetical protein